MLALGKRIACGARARARLLGAAAELDAIIEKLDASPAPSTPEIASLVRQCGAEGCIDRARRLHSWLVRSRRDHGFYIGNLVIEMYGACAAVEEAATVFANLRERNVFTWTLVMKAYARNGHFDKALDVYHRMDVTPNRVTFIGALGVCSSLANLEQGRRVHADIVRCGLETDLMIQNSLVNMYGKCGSASESRKVFDAMLEKDVISWNSIIDALASCGAPGEAVETYRRMKQGADGTTPNAITFLTVLAGCSNLDEVAEVRSDIYACRLEENPVIGSKLVSVYAKCGDLAQARKFFDCMAQRVVVSWNSMITAYAQSRHFREALCIYRKMELDGTRPDDTTFLNVIGCVQDLPLARWLSERILLAGYKVQALAGAIVNLFGRLGSLEDASRVFDSCTSSNRDVSLWNAMIAAFSLNGYRRKALDLYRTMVDVKKDEVTFLSVLGACTSAVEVSMVHEDAVKSRYSGSDKVENALITSYSKCGDLESSKQVFEGMDPERRSSISWGAMIASYTRNGRPLESLDTFQRMCEDGRTKVDAHIVANLAKACSELGDLEQAKMVYTQAKQGDLNEDTSVQTAMISMFAKCGSLEDAWSVFSKLESQSRDTICWTSMISAFVSFGYGEEALRLFRRMDLEGVKPNAITFLSAVEACSLIADAFACGKALHQRVVLSGYESHEALRTALISMYSRCGKLADASLTFRSQGNDALEWTAMITACARHGTVEQALELVKEMELCGVPPDMVTLLSVLSMCSHAGRLKEGWDYFSVMSSEHGIQLVADHFTCLVDLLGRAGWMQEAEDLLLNMPCEPDVVTWTSFLGACNMHGDVERGRLATSKLMDLGEDSGPFVMLANTQLQQESSAVMNRSLG